MVDTRSLILADEPTGNLDTETGADVIDLLAGLGERHGRSSRFDL